MAIPGKPSNLHDLAVHIASDIQDLVAGLARAGVDEAATQKLSKMSGTFGQIAKQLAAGGPMNAETGQAPLNGQQSQQPQAQPEAQPQEQQPQNIDQATSALHHAMVQQANRRAMMGA